MFCTHRVIANLDNKHPQRWYLKKKAFEGKENIQHYYNLLGEYCSLTMWMSDCANSNVSQMPKKKSIIPSKDINFYD